MIILTITMTIPTYVHASYTNELKVPLTFQEVDVLNAVQNTTLCPDCLTPKYINILGHFKNLAHLQRNRNKMLNEQQDMLTQWLKLTSLSGTERIEESNNEVNENCEVERDVVPQRHVTAHPEQQWVC